MQILAKITPNSSLNTMKIDKNGVLKIKLTEQAEKEKANKQLIRLLCDFYKVNSTQINIRSGKHSRIKRIEIKIGVK